MTMRYLRVLALAACALLAAGPALAQTEPKFETPPKGAGATRLKPVCRYEPSFLQGGTIVLFSGPAAEEAAAEKRRPQLRGIASRLVTLAPATTSLTLEFSVEAPDPAAALAQLAAGRAAVEAALAAGGHPVVGQKADWVTLDPDASPVPARVRVTLSMAGEVDPLAAAALMPDAPGQALVAVARAFDPKHPVPDALRAELEAEARADAERRAAAREDGAQILKRSGFTLDLPARRQATARPRQTVEVTGVATYVLSLPPGTARE